MRSPDSLAKRGLLLRGGREGEGGKQREERRGSLRIKGGRESEGAYLKVVRKGWKGREGGKGREGNSPSLVKVGRINTVCNKHAEPR